MPPGGLEKQFRNYYSKASGQTGVTGENLLRLLEARFDVVWDAGHASTEPGIVDALIRATDQALTV